MSGTWDALKGGLAQEVHKTVQASWEAGKRSAGATSVVHAGGGIVAGTTSRLPAADPDQPPPPPKDPLHRVQQVLNKALGTFNAPQAMLNAGSADLTAPIAALFPPLPAATLGSLYVGPPHGHLHPPSFTPPATPAPVPLPSLGPVLLGTCVKVLINRIPAARAGDIGIAMTCCGIFPAFKVFTGSSKVFIGGSRAARLLDICRACQPAPPRVAEAGKVMAAVGKVAGKAGTALDVAGSAAGLVAGGVGVAVDVQAAEASDDGTGTLAAAMDAASRASPWCRVSRGLAGSTAPARPGSRTIASTSYPRLSACATR